MDREMGMAPRQQDNLLRVKHMMTWEFGLHGFVFSSGQTQAWRKRRVAFSQAWCLPNGQHCGNRFPFLFCRVGGTACCGLRVVIQRWECRSLCTAKHPEHSHRNPGILPCTFLQGCPYFSSNLTQHVARSAWQVGVGGNTEYPEAVCPRPHPLTGDPCQKRGLTTHHRSRHHHNNVYHVPDRWGSWKSKSPRNLHKTPTETGTQQ